MGGPARRRGVPKKADRHKNVLKNDKTGIEYVATGAQDSIPRKKNPSPFTVSNYLQSTGQSIIDAASVMVVFVSIIGTVWYLSAHPAVQDAVRAARMLHGTVDLLKRHPKEESAYPYVTNPFLWRWMVGCPENQEIFQQEGGLLPFLQIVKEDKNFVLTRITLAGMQTALQTSYYWEPEHRQGVAELLVNFLRTGKKGVAQQTAASILANLLGDADFGDIIVNKLGGLPDLEAVAGWSEDASIRETLTEAITAAAAETEAPTSSD